VGTCQAARSAAERTGAWFKRLSEGATPGVEDAQHAQASAQALGVAAQIQEGLGGGGKDDVQAGAGMGTEPVAEGFGDGELRCSDRPPHRHEETRLTRTPRVRIRTLSYPDAGGLARVLGERFPLLNTQAPNNYEQ
jgi:hypothetical protein